MMLADRTERKTQRCVLRHSGASQGGNYLREPGNDARHTIIIDLIRRVLPGVIGGIAKQCCVGDHHPRVPLRCSPPPSCGACPNHATPRSAWPQCMYAKVLYSSSVTGAPFRELCEGDERDVSNWSAIVRPFHTKRRGRLSAYHVAREA